MHGTLIQICADNLGANNIGGFVESFSANFPCRRCLTSKHDMQSFFRDEKCVKRNEENYEAHMQSLQQNPNSVSEHGVKGPCILNRLEYFHMTKNYAPDVMHDILEGVGKREAILLLKHFIFEEKLSINTRRYGSIYKK